MYFVYWYIFVDFFVKFMNGVEVFDVWNVIGVRGVWDDENIIRFGLVVIFDEFFGEWYFVVDVDVICIVFYISFGLC